jgi:pyruvate,water dikinase
MFTWWRRVRGSKSEGEPVFRQAYASFRRLLGRNSELLSLFTDLETDLKYVAPSAPEVRDRTRRILAISLDLIQDLNELQDGHASRLFRAHERIEASLRAGFEGLDGPTRLPLVLSLDDAATLRPEHAGGKAANLAALRAALPGVVPDGFVITTSAYRRLEAAAGVTGTIRGLVAGSNDGEAVLERHADELRSQLARATVPPDVQQAVMAQLDSRTSSTRWAVRSSGVGEDGQLLFAGQFESLLGVPTAGVLEAYLTVAASRFSRRALAYRLTGGLTEFDTPMAVLALAMVDARASGVLYTRDPHDPSGDSMWLTSTFGLGADVLAGEAGADLFVIARHPPGRVIEQRIAEKAYVLGLTDGPPYLRRVDLTGPDRTAPSLAADEIRAIAELGLAAERHFGQPQDVEWALDTAGAIRLLQSRPLVLGTGPSGRDARSSSAPVVLRGRPLGPGRAVGIVQRAPEGTTFDEVRADAVLVVRQPTPEISRVLGTIAALVAEEGTPQSHAAALVRQAGVPAIYGATGALARLVDGEAVGVDGSRGEVYAGTPWPELRGRRGSRSAVPRAQGFVHQLVLTLNLGDPAAPRFGADGCRSIHDIVRVVHERALAAMFRMGDRYSHGSSGISCRLDSPLPLNVGVLDLGGAIAAEAERRARRVGPGAIRSIPFAALWIGLADPRVTWAGRRVVSAAGFWSVVQGGATGDAGAMRHLGDRNYLIVAPDYVNFNARLAYHYAMIDAVVGELDENNYIAFRFCGGGASEPRRDRRAQFLGLVLGRLGFGTDRRGDLVNAWLRASPRQACEEALTHLGRLMACARQLDMLLDDDEAVGAWAKRFLDGDYEAFG